MNTRPENLALLLARFPENSHWLIEQYISKYSFQLKITKPRKLRLGSFRAARKGEMPVISLNNDLGLYSFLLVFIHELAHLVVWQQHSRRASPHGIEWKNNFRSLIDPLFEHHLFSAELRQGLERYFLKTPASFQHDVKLQRLLHALDGNGEFVTLGDIPDKEPFHLSDGRQMVKLERVRTRYKCFCPSNKRYYLVSPAAQIFRSENL